MDKKFYRRLLTSAFLLFLPLLSFGQLPTCVGGGGYVYFLRAATEELYNYDPLLPLSATNPFQNTIGSLPFGAEGLAVNNNLNGGTPSPTFYTIFNNTHHYYNGTTWVNTGHGVGSTFASNSCGAGPFIYSLDGFTGSIYKYDGTGNGSLLITISDFDGAGPWDLQGDCQGNFYILKYVATALGPAWLRKYSPTGALLQSWTVTNGPSVSTSGGGFGIIGNQVFFENNTFSLFTGTLGPTTVTFGTPQPISNADDPQDFGTCPLCDIIQADKDTVYVCDYNMPTGTTVNASGTGPFTWNVIQGAATITPNTGPTVVITPLVTGVTRVVLGSTTVALKDTVTFIVPTATVNAGPDDTIRGCAPYTDTIYAALSNTLAGMAYTYSWTPAAAILAGGNTLTPVVQPAGTTSFILAVSSLPNQGGCTWRDTTVRYLKNISVDADFSFIQRWGCEEDTLLLSNHTINFDSAGLNSVLTYAWEFGDNTGDTAKAPTHIYPNQGSYSVKLSATNGVCKDSIIKVVDFNHPLAASFTQSADSFCQGGTVAFTNTSVTTIRNGIAPKYFWTFGDGGTSTVENPTYTFTKAGVWPVVLQVTDFVPCTDTATSVVVIDSIPFVSLVTSDSPLCVGQAVTFIGSYLDANNTGLTWSFGDGTASENASPVTHGYDEPGFYTVTLTAAYRICPDTTATREIEIRPFTSINIGPDTSICPGGEPLVLSARLSDGSLAPGTAMVRWNTGDTASSILVRHHGDYWAVADLRGCTSADSVHVAKDCYLDLPNVFSPNGDGVNDYFWPRQLLSEGITAFHMTIYNRWGQKIWETTRIDGRGWDGRFNGEAQPTGVYIYLVEAELKNGFREKYQGNVTLLR